MPRLGSALGPPLEMPWIWVKSQFSSGFLLALSPVLDGLGTKPGLTCMPDSARAHDNWQNIKFD